MIKGNNPQRKCLIAAKNQYTNRQKLELKKTRSRKERHKNA